jgi:isopentenyldiphosphate isomerase
MVMDSELLDVVDERGRHVGVKRRDAVHRDGDWHVAFHLWVTRGDGVLLQRRARTKASWPGFLDATAAGHLLAGERVRDGLREAEEELGVAYAFERLTALGVHRVDEARGRADGLVNRELQHVYAVRDDRPLEAWTGLDPDEVAGLVLVGHRAFAALASGDATRRWPARAWDRRRVTAIQVEASELVPTPYLSALASRLARVGTPA